MRAEAAARGDPIKAALLEAGMTSNKYDSIMSTKRQREKRNRDRSK